LAVIKEIKAALHIRSAFLVKENDFAPT